MNLYLSNRFVKPLGIRLTAIFILLLIAALGELFIRAQAAEIRSMRYADILSKDSLARAEIETQLSALLYLNSGLISYLVVHREP